MSHRSERDAITGQWGFGPGEFTLIMDGLGALQGYTETIRRKPGKNLAVMEVYANSNEDGNEPIARYKANLKQHKRMAELRYGGGYISTMPDGGDFTLTWKGKSYGLGEFRDFGNLAFSAIE